MSKPATGRQCGGGCGGSPALFWAAGAWSACRSGRQQRTLTCTDSQKGRVRHEVRHMLSLHCIVPAKFMFLVFEGLPLFTIPYAMSDGVIDNAFNRFMCVSMRCQMASLNNALDCLMCCTRVHHMLINSICTLKTEKERSIN